MQSLCAGVQGWQRTAGVKGCGSPVATFAVTPQKHRPTRSGDEPIGRLRAAAIIGSRVKRLAQGKLMLASTCTGYYLTQNFTGFAASPPSPARNIFAGRRKNV